MALDGEPPREARGVTYTESDLAPGLKLFRCEAYRATLATKSCATRWREAETATGERRARLEACRTCPIGAAHAGCGVVKYSKWYGSSICPRCGRGTTRMISGRYCVSCYNRQREMKAGKNARGNRPVELLANPLRTIEYRLEVDRAAHRVRDSDTSGSTESMVQVLRTTKGDIAFGFSGRILRRQDGAQAAATETSGVPVVEGEAGTADYAGPEPGSDAAVRRGQVCRYRALLFTSTALMARAKKEPARHYLAG